MLDSMSGVGGVRNCQWCGMRSVAGDEAGDAKVRLWLRSVDAVPGATGD